MAYSMYIFLAAGIPALMHECLKTMHHLSADRLQHNASNSNLSVKLAKTGRNPQNAGLPLDLQTRMSMH